ncbi:hypothetical protein BD311DRAFT_651774 [Dichomitus squalens]|uniref:Uncharacterized protein n=1 Tax=Dichomitus squalens TaxID=114155 RepID=A0A4Q9N498_9APHY|nr:hypothetical protein BD311DRAFT_651774 [Dichomitus squalens]
MSFLCLSAPPVSVRVPRSVPPLPPTVPKKALTARPIIWAKSRQEVCESLDWFRSYQSGVYHSKELVKGYLLSAFSADRDIFARDGRLIISHGGGKAESLHNTKGRARLQKASDQEEGDKSVRALLRTQQMGRPVVLIIDDRYALFPYDLSTKPNCTYVVLGFYHIAHAWAERQPADNNHGFVVRYKFAFEWCDKQPAPWWIEQDGSSGLETSRIAYSLCASCHKASPRVYEQGWMCLHPGCVAFWIMNGTSPPQDLSYSEAFLRASLECNHEAMEDIAPQTPVTEATDGVITSRRFTRGWHCKDCGRLSCRYKWQYWECQNCGATLQIIGMARSPKDLRAQKSLGFLTHKVAEDSGIQVSQLMPFRDEELHAYYHIYILPENRGRIYLILGTPRTNEVADEIFQEYQDQAGTGELQLRRWPLKRHQCRGELLTNYFSHNTGEPYQVSTVATSTYIYMLILLAQYVGGTADTVPFDVAPSAVVKARDLIQSRMMSIIQAENQPYRFNEVLSAAYMEEQSMAGDVLIMDGAQIQEYYEHTVVPHNFRIAATARYIDNRSH